MVPYCLYNYGLWYLPQLDLNCYLARCLNVGMAAYKFKALSSHLLTSACEHCQRFSLYDPPLPSKWLPFLPLELSFPEDVFFSHCWDLTQTAERLHQLNMNICINHHCTATAVRIATADFVDAVHLPKCLLQDVPLDGSWLIPIFAHKKPPPPWVELVLELRLNPQHELDRIPCITQIPLHVWHTLNVAEIRSKFLEPREPRADSKLPCTDFVNLRTLLLPSLDCNP